jgi:ankyrin repeat protein
MAALEMAAAATYDNHDSVVGSSIVDRLFSAIDTAGGDLDDLRALLSQKQGRGRLAVSDNDINRALLQAARYGCRDVESFRLLWQRLGRSGKRKHFTALSGTGHGLLHVAVEKNHFEIVQVLIDEFNFNINQEETMGNTALFFANVMNVEIIGYLLEHGADAAYGNLHSAVVAGSTEVVRLLLQ